MFYTLFGEPRPRPLPPPWPPLGSRPPLLSEAADESFELILLVSIRTIPFLSISFDYSRTSSLSLGCGNYVVCLRVCLWGGGRRDNERRERDLLKLLVDRQGSPHKQLSYTSSLVRNAAIFLSSPPRAVVRVRLYDAQNCSAEEKLFLVVYFYCTRREKRFSFILLCLFSLPSSPLSPFSPSLSPIPCRMNSYRDYFR